MRGTKHELNAPKEKILKIAADLRLGREPRPGSGSLDSVKSLAQCIALVLETRAGRNPPMSSAAT
jgi:hypothetical protein